MVVGQLVRVPVLLFVLHLHVWDKTVARPCQDSQAGSTKKTSISSKTWAIQYFIL